MVLRIFYTMAIGIVVAALVHFGIEAFYPAPTPQYSTSSGEQFAPPTPTNENELILYNKNLFFAQIGIALVLTVASLAIFKGWLVIQEGLALGGVFIFLTTVFRGLTVWPPAGKREVFVGLLFSLAVLVALAFAYFPREVKKKAKERS